MTFIPLTITLIKILNGKGPLLNTIENNKIKKP